MAPKKDSSSSAAQSAASVSVDLGMTDAALGATIRGILGKLAATEVVTVVPERGRNSGVHRRGVKTFDPKGKMQGVTMADIQAASDPQNLELAEHVLHAPKLVKRHRTKGHFTVSVRDSVEVNIDLDTPKEAIGAGDELDRAILAADKRGQAIAKAHVDSDEFFTTAEVATRIGISRQAVAKRRDSGTILALKAGPKALKYPEWQILPTGQVAPGIEDVLARVDGDAWTAYRFLTEVAPDGTDRPLYQLLREGDIDTVLAHIDGVLGGAST